MVVAIVSVASAYPNIIDITVKNIDEKVAEPVLENTVDTVDDARVGVEGMLHELDEDLKDGNIPDALMNAVDNAVNGVVNPTIENVEDMLIKALTGTGEITEELLNELLKLYNDEEEQN